MWCNPMEERGEAHAAFIRRNVRDPSIAALFTIDRGSRFRTPDGLESVKKSQQVAACLAGHKACQRLHIAIQPGSFH